MTAKPTADPPPNYLLSRLGPEERRHLDPHLELVQLPTGKVLYESGESIRHCYFPLDSILSLVSVMETGQSAEMNTIGREGLLDAVPWLGDATSFGRYTVQLPGEALKVGREHVVEVMRRSEAFQQLIYRYVQATLSQAFQLVACNVTHPVEARCCRWILMTQDRLMRDSFPLTHEFLAQMLGVQRPTVSVVTRTLQTAELIRQARGNITVIDREGLKDTACECYGIIRRSYEELLPGVYSGEPS